MSTLRAISPARGLRAGERLGRAVRATPWPICAVTALAAGLRFAQLGSVSSNPFYDAAVHSMALSWRNFLFGAFDPGAILSIDKPPLDLWLQVLSVKLFGWSSFALKLPEALAGTLAVPLLYDAVRRAAGVPGGLAAAATLAVLPESVLTARSDTMDAVMMLLVVAAMWLTILAASSGRRRFIVLAGVALGLAFNVKLLQALVGLPALALLYLLGARHPLRRKLIDLALAGAALVAMGLLWAVVVTLAPGRHPWAVGSSDGSVWNAMFVFNGVGKIGGASASTKPGGPGPFRLLVSTGWHYDLLFGCVLVAAVVIGVAGLAVAASRSRRRELSAAVASRRLGASLAISAAVWIAVALVVFDTMVTVHARYLEALAPAVAVAIGLGAAALARLGDRSDRPPSLLVVVFALACVCAYTVGLGRPSIAGGAGALIISAAGAVLVARAPGRIGVLGRWLTAAFVVACALVFPVHETFVLVRSHANDSAGLAIAPQADTAALSDYLQARTAGVRYELAADEPLGLAPLLIRDGRPILPLTSFGGRRLTSLSTLRAAVAAGEIRYALVGNYHCGVHNAGWAACSPAALWIRQTGINVTRQAGLGAASSLYELVPSMAGRAA